MIRIRRETGSELSRVSTKSRDLFHALQTDEFKTVDQFMQRLAELRELRGETISLKELRYIDVEKVKELETTIAEQNTKLSERCVQFLLQPEALEPYQQRAFAENTY